MRKEIETALFVGSTLILYEASRLAFSRRSREIIKERSSSRSELTGRNDLPRQAIHINHSRAYPHYDNPENGFFGTIDEHLIDHITRAGANGLSSNHNQHAVDSLYEQVKKCTSKSYADETVSIAREMIRRGEDFLNTENTYYHQVRGNKQAFWVR